MTLPNPGDKVKVITKDGVVEGTEKSKISGTSNKVFEGILMPNEESDAIVIKLDSGYNVGFDKKNVKKVELVKKYSEKEENKEKKLAAGNNLPKISILHTGGTIASKVNYETGGVIAKFHPAELEEMFSEDMRFTHYQKIGKEIKKEVEKGVAGIIITHGTDTMAYSAAALAFILENVNIPILLVGAQRSSDRGSSDAAMNLICAAEFITKSDFAGVAICMHENTEDNNSIILPACKTRKMHTSRRDAFRPINDTPIARINYDTRKIEFIRTDYTKKSEKKLNYKDGFADKVGIIKCHPNMFKEEFDFFKGY